MPLTASLLPLCLPHLLRSTDYRCDRLGVPKPVPRTLRGAEGESGWGSEFCTQPDTGCRGTADSQAPRRKPEALRKPRGGISELTRSHSCSGDFREDLPGTTSPGEGLGWYLVSCQARAKSYRGTRVPSEVGPPVKGPVPGAVLRAREEPCQLHAGPWAEPEPLPRRAGVGDPRHPPQGSPHFGPQRPALPHPKDSS